MASPVLSVRHPSPQEEGVMRIVWLSIAQRDLLSISAYYEGAANKDVAKRVLHRLVRSATSLIDNPYLGHPLPPGVGHVFALALGLN